MCVCVCSVKYDCFPSLKVHFQTVHPCLYKNLSSFHLYTDKIFYLMCINKTYLLIHLFSSKCLSGCLQIFFLLQKINTTMNILVHFFQFTSANVSLECLIRTDEQYDFFIFNFSIKFKSVFQMCFTNFNSHQKDMSSHCFSFLTAFGFVRLLNFCQSGCKIVSHYIFNLHSICISLRVCQAGAADLRKQRHSCCERSLQKQKEV